MQFIKLAKVIYSNHFNIFFKKLFLFLHKYCIIQLSMPEMGVKRLENMKMTRKDARITAFKLLYQLDVQKETPESIFEIYYNLHQNIDGKSKEYIENIVYGVNEHIAEIDSILEKHSVNRKVSRFSKIVAAASRLAVYEILYCEDIPPVVSVNEAVAIVKEYESEESAGFVNGILGNVLKEQE